MITNKNLKCLTVFTQLKAFSNGETFKERMRGFQYSIARINSLYESDINFRKFWKISKKKNRGPTPRIVSNADNDSCK
jgi:hypothetical protein